jgi:prepilin-type processing-associated H-X9-DG protein
MDTYVPIPSGTDAPEQGGRIRFRHIQKANAVMVDGHVESYKTFSNGGPDPGCEMRNRNVFPLR